MFDRRTPAPQPDGPWIGRALPRFEDRRLTSGQGRFSSDFAEDGAVHAVFLRSDHASARIVALDVAAARAAPGVLAVLTGADYVDAGHGPIRHMADPADARDHTKRAFRGLPGAVSIDLPHLPMPTDRLRYTGEPFVMVVAETEAQARDAAELIVADLDPEPSVTDMEAALVEGAPLVDPQIPGNLAVDATVGDMAAAEAALAGAHLVVDETFRNQRIVNAQMEPRAAMALVEPDTGTLRMIAGSQGAVRQRDTLADCLGLPKEAVEVICPDVGGGFGPRTNLSPEQPMLALAARITGRPVRWNSTRTEAFLSDYQGRDLTIRLRAGFDADGRITGIAASITGNVGAYTVAFVPLSNSYRVLTGVYDVPVAGIAIRGVMTHTVPTAPYRGAGRPEATLALERSMDIAARRLGLDRIELRRRNLIARNRLPYRSATGLVFDSGDFAANMDRALDLADWQGFAARREAARARGMLAGIGMANYIESPVGIPHERVDVTVLEDTVEVVTGTQSTGQGHETSFAQVMADLLGVTPDQVRLVSGDTRRVVSGGGSHSDRSMRLGGTLLVEASGTIVLRARAVIAHLYGVSADQVTWEDGLLRLGNRSFTIFEAAGLAHNADLPPDVSGSLAATASFTGRIPAHPTGAAVCEVEIDPETGQVEITRYASVDDAGQPINPLILHGQVHGGIAQGVGQALMEGLVHQDGQVVNASFMDYAMPRADTLPTIAVDLVEDPTTGNPLRVKGGGESGITPALATTMNAVHHALSPLGVERVEMPASPARVWRAIAAAGGRAQ